MLAQINPNLFNQKIFGGGSGTFSGTTTLGDILTKFLPFLFPLVGLLLFVYLLFGGFSYLTSGGDPKGMEKAQGQITNAIVGFVIVFLAYWLVQIFEFIFNIKVF